MNASLDEKEKGEVRNPANGEGDTSGKNNIENSVTDFFKLFVRFRLD